MVIYAACTIEEEYYHAYNCWYECGDECIDGYFLSKEDALKMVRNAENRYRNFGSCSHIGEETVIDTGLGLRHRSYVKEITVN